MQVLSRCPLGVASILWLPRSGSYTLTVVCKATFRLEPDLSPLAEDQEPVTEGDTFWDHDEGKSLDLATDLVPFKRSPEVLLAGHAFAPRGQAVGTLTARLTVAEIDKAIEVTGDRHFTLDGALTHPARFSKMPLRWERAAGGPDTSNPVGVPMGEEARPDGWGRIQVPNLVPLGRMISSRDDVVPPACFAPMAAHWPLRLSRLHRYASGWSPHAWHARPLPTDFDASYFNAAPPDQMLREIVGSERITLENLHPHHPLLTTRLERVSPRAIVDWGGGSSNEIALTCDTLLVDTDRSLATLTFRGHVTLDYPERSGWVIVTTDGAASAAAGSRSTPAWRSLGKTAPLVDTGASAPVPTWIANVRDVNETVAHDGDDAASTALPFVAESGSDLDFALPDDLDDEETFTSQKMAPTGALPAVPPVVPKGPRLGAFRLAGASEPPGAAPSGAAQAIADPSEIKALPAIDARGMELEDAPTMDPDDAVLESFADAPDAQRPALSVGIPVPASKLAAAPPPPIAGVPPPIVAAPSSAAAPFRPATWAGPALPSSAVMPFAPSPADTGAHAAKASAASEPGASGLPFLPATSSASPAAISQATGLPFAPAARTSVPGMTIGERAHPAAAHASAPGMTIGERAAQTRGLGFDAPPSFAPESTRDVVVSESPPPPPPRLGPLATPAMVTEDLVSASATTTSSATGATGATTTSAEMTASSPVGAVASGEAAHGAGSAGEPARGAEPGDGALAAAAPAAGAPEVPEPLPLDEYPIERCARIAASVARTRDRQAEILEANKLDAERWEALKTHWAAEIKKETERGKTTLLRAYDASYVAQLEDERGPIAIEEYARIVVAAERGTVNATLTDLRLPEGSMLRIQRVWMGRTGKDPELRRLVRSAIEMASDA